MRVADRWEDYELIDCSSGEKLERWGDVILVRPDPQIIWKTPKKNRLWSNADAYYHRSNSGGGHWEFKRDIKDSWKISYDGLSFKIKTMGFKHTGLFPEQAINWDLIRRLIRSEKREVKVLNLFAYTGGATVASLSENASVVHVDAAKGMVSWAKENAELSKLSNGHVRWIVDDCVKFVKREIRRQNKYDIIIMDPPSYGRGPNGETWKIENEIFDLVKLCSELLNEDSLALFINSYTTGLSPSVMEYLLTVLLKEKFGGFVNSDEIGLKITENGLCLPCGSTAIWSKSNLENV